METSAAGAVVEFNCAHASIDGPIRLDANGRFKATGFYVQERGGPVREGDEEEKAPATFVGELKGNDLVFELRLQDTNEEMGTFTLVRDRAPQIRKCR